jgi:hypothetical protein
MSARPSPPPLREKSAPPPRRASLKPVDAEPPPGDAARDDDDPTQGEWLFKQNDMVLGPVTAIVLVERIKQGELSADTPIARDGQPFKPMKLVPLFREAYEAKLERKKREEEERAYNAAVSRARLLKVVIFALIVLVPAAAGAVLGRTLMTLKPWDDTPSWIAKAPPLVDLPPRPIEVKRVEEPKRPADDDDDDTADDKAEKGKRLARGDGGKKGDKSEKKAEKSEGKGEDKAEQSSAGADKGFVKELTNEQVTAPLKDPAVRGPLAACLKAEVESNPDMPTTVNLAYTITEAGRAANVQL